MHAEGRHRGARALSFPDKLNTHIKPLTNLRFEPQVSEVFDSGSIGIGADQSDVDERIEQASLVTEDYRKVGKWVNPWYIQPSSTRSAQYQDLLEGLRVCPKCSCSYGTFVDIYKVVSESPLRSHQSGSSSCTGS